MSLAHRRTAVIENEQVRLTLLPGGGHIAEVLLKANGVNPLWNPPWESMEPSAYDRDEHTQYGTPMEGGLLAGIAGHNLCFDFFGGPSEEELAAGLHVHGEASFVDWDVTASGEEMTATAELPIAQMRMERRLRLVGDVVLVRETARNLSGVDRPVGWTQHVTLGPPFLVKGETELHASATSSKVSEEDFAPGYERLRLGAEFQWPYAPAADGGWSDMRVFTDAPGSGAFTTHLMAPGADEAFFCAYSPATRTAFGYVWRRADFPWLGIWEENYSRKQEPWNGKTLTRGLEFGVSPYAETRRQMVDRGTLFGEKTFLWMPAGAEKTVEYALFIRKSDAAPRAARRSGDGIEIG